MRTAALAGTQGRPVGTEWSLTRARALSCSHALARPAGTRTLKDWLAALRHAAARRRSRRTRLRWRRWRRSIHGTRSRLGNNQPAHRRRRTVGCSRSLLRFCWRRDGRSGCLSGFAGRFNCSYGCNLVPCFRNPDTWRRNFGRSFDRHRSLLCGANFSRLGGFLGSGYGRSYLRRYGNRGR